MIPMTTFMLAASWMGFIRGLFVALFIITSILLMCVVLLQKGRGGGLSSAFGGAGGASPFGTKTGDVFTWITVVLAGIFLLTALFLNRIYVGETFAKDRGQPSKQSPLQQPTGAETPAGAEGGAEAPVGTGSATTQPAK